MLVMVFDRKFYKTYERGLLGILNSILLGHNIF